MTLWWSSEASVLGLHEALWGRGEVVMVAGRRSGWCVRILVVGALYTIF